MTSAFFNALLVALVGFAGLMGVPVSDWTYGVMLAGGLYQAALLALSWAVARQERRAAEERDDPAERARWSEGHYRRRR